MGCGVLNHAALQRDAVIAVAGDVIEQAFGAQREEVPAERVVELLAELSANAFQRPWDRHRGPIRPRARHRVEGARLDAASDWSAVQPSTTSVQGILSGSDGIRPPSFQVSGCAAFSVTRRLP